MSWYKKYLPVFEKPFSQAPQEIIEEIKSNLHRVQSDNPVATVAIIAYNEEIRLLSCIWSLSESSCKYPIEIIGIDNNSTDATPDVYKAVNLPYFTETNKGPGYARNRGLTEARGKYYLCIDSDTMYPKKYVEKMIEELERPGVVAVSASYSYVPSREYPKYWLSVYEFIRDVHLFLLSFKNPVWCVRGAVFGHSVELARKIGGYRVHITRGEDGSMAYDLKQFGRISFKRGCKTRAITCTKSIGADRIGNNLFQIATGASLAHRNNCDYIVCIPEINVPDGISLKEYVNQFHSNILRNVKFMDGIPEDSTEYIQPCFEYREIEYFDKIRLSGYFQSEKFFDKDYVRELFSPDEETLSHIDTTYGHLFEEEIISINVRRGDYLTRPLRQPICEMPYFKRAINYFGKDKRYLLISDDIDWCKSKFKGSNFYFIDDEPPIIDLYLQTMCTHNIISNSTFSWWGAWLNPNPSKIVVAPIKWFGVQMNNFNTRDLIPQEWVRVANPRTLSLKLKISYRYFIDLFIRANWKYIRIRNRIKNHPFFSK